MQNIITGGNTGDCYTKSEKSWAWQLMKTLLDYTKTKIFCVSVKPSHTYEGKC